VEEKRMKYWTKYYETMDENFGKVMKGLEKNE